MDVVEEADGERAGRVVKADGVVRDVLDQGLVKRVLEKDGERGIFGEGMIVTGPAGDYWFGN